MAEIELGLTHVPIDFSEVHDALAGVEEALAKAITKSIKVENVKQRKYPAALFVPARFLPAAQALERAVGSENLRVMQIGQSVLGFRFTSVLAWKHRMEDVEEERFNRWWNESVQFRLVPGCEENIRVVQV